MSTNLQDVLRPEIDVVGGRRYRKVQIKYKGSMNISTSNQSRYTEEDDYAYFDEAESCLSEFDGIVKSDSGYKLTLENIPSFYYKFIIGKSNETRKKLENETKARIEIPRDTNGKIIISARERSHILSAKTRIEVLVESSRQKTPATYFLSIPLISEEITQQFEQFKEAVLQTCAGVRGLDASIFQLPTRLHLTIGLLNLQDDNEVSQAASILSDIASTLVEKYITSNPFTIKLSGIEYMNDDPAEVDVLYAKVSLDDGSNRLQAFVDDLVQAFIPSGLMKREQFDRVKLHATVMNTIFRESRDEENSETKKSIKQSKRKIRVTFDAREILKVFDSFDFGELCIESLHLSQRGQYGPSGYYRKAASVSLL